MKYIKNLALALLCAGAATLAVTSCDEEPTFQDNTQITFMTSASIWVFENGVSEREMVEGDSLKLPDSYSWKSDNEAVATVVEEDSESWLKAVGVGTATVSDEDAELKIIVTVKEREQ